MPRRLFFLSAVLVLLLGSNLAMADTVPTYFPTGEFDYTQLRVAASGAASAPGPWDFSFLTADPLASWFRDNDDCDYYCWWGGNSYGPGGTFILTGPEGEVFTASFSGGWYYEEGAYEHITISDNSLDMWMSGEWDTGLRQAAHLQMHGQLDRDQQTVWAYLDFFPVPEPSSLMLVGSGAVGLAGVLRRKPAR